MPDLYRKLRIMGAHKMLTTGASASGTLADATYVAGDLVDGDPLTNVRGPVGGSLSVAVTGTSVVVNGLVVGYSNLNGGTSVGFSGLGAVVMPAVPLGTSIRLNGVTYLVSPVTAGSTIISVSGHPTDVIIGEAVVGTFEEVRALPFGSGLNDFKSFSVPHPGRLGGPAYSFKAEARQPFGGDVYLTATEKDILLACWRASDGNNNATLLWPDPDDPTDVRFVNWDRFAFTIAARATAAQPAIYRVNVMWSEIPRVAHNV
jgi:hypothetical protein